MNVKEIRKLLVELIDEDSRNIPRQLKRAALQETCVFVQENMPLTRWDFNDRYHLLDFAIQQVCTPKGLWMEFGVYQGSTIQFIAQRAKCTVYGFDSFKGNPEDWRSEYPRGAFALPQPPALPENIFLVTGYFQDTLASFLESHIGPAAFVHIDCDLYSSTKTVLEALQDRIVAGTVMVFDEFFNYPGWKQHESRAFLEFVAQKGKSFEYLGYVYHHSQVAIKFLD